MCFLRRLPRQSQAAVRHEVVSKKTQHSRFLFVDVGGRGLLVGHGTGCSKSRSGRGSGGGRCCACGCGHDRGGGGGGGSGGGGGGACRSSCGSASMVHLAAQRPIQGDGNAAFLHEAEHLRFLSLCRHFSVFSRAVWVRIVRFLDRSVGRQVRSW